jgi:hypothetical protein
MDKSTTLWNEYRGQIAAMALGGASSWFKLRYGMELTFEEMTKFFNSVIKPEFWIETQIKLATFVVEKDVKGVMFVAKDAAMEAMNIFIEEYTKQNNIDDEKMRLRA